MSIKHSYLTYSDISSPASVSKELIPPPLWNLWTPMFHDHITVLPCLRVCLTTDIMSQEDEDGDPTPSSWYCPVSCLPFITFLDGAPHSCYLYCLVPVWLIPHPHSTTGQQRMAIPLEPMDNFLCPFYLATLSFSKHLHGFNGSAPSQFSISCISPFAHASLSSWPLITGLHQASIRQPSSPHWLQRLQSPPNGQ